MKQLCLLAALFLALATALSLTGCGGGSSAGNPAVSTEDDSASGFAASAAGGALSGSTGGGTLAIKASSTPVAHSFAYDLQRALEFFPEALAGTICPTWLSAAGSGCTQSGDSLWMGLDECSYILSTDVWNGTVSLISTSPARCGHFPMPAAGGNITRAYVAGVRSAAGGVVTIVSAFGTSADIDDASPNLANFNGDTIPPVTSGGGYGSQVGFNSSDARDSIVLGHRLVVVGQMDMSVSGNLSVDEVAGASSRTLSGNLTVYHNGLRVIATSIFDSVVHENTCCLPVSGSITTAYTAGSNVAPTSAGAAYVGRTETLTLNGCGSGTLIKTDGSSESVTLSRCF